MSFAVSKFYSASTTKPWSSHQAQSPQINLESNTSIEPKESIFVMLILEEWIDWTHLTRTYKPSRKTAACNHREKLIEIPRPKISLQIVHLLSITHHWAAAVRNRAGEIHARSSRSKKCTANLMNYIESGKFQLKYRSWTQGMMQTHNKFQPIRTNSSAFFGRKRNQSISWYSSKASMDILDSPVSEYPAIKGFSQ